MTIFALLIFFLIPIYVVMMAMFKFDMQKKVGNYLVLIVSFGVAPFINSVLMYYLTYLLPNSKDWTYISFLLLFWIFFLFLFVGEYKKVISLLRCLLKRFFASVKQTISLKIIIFFVIVLLFFLIYSLQALFYPIIDGDNAHYINQGKAVYERKNFDWQKSAGVMINGDDYYVYNAMIRPAVPFFMATVYLVVDEKDGNFVYQFLHWYYFILLFLIFIFAVDLLNKKRSSSLEINKDHIFWGALFFFFSWGLVRLFIFGLKESIIYFYLIVSLILVSKLIGEKSAPSNKNDFRVPFLLAIVIGLNMFVNQHGIIIGFLIFAILFFINNYSISKKILFIFSIFVFSLPLGGFEFFNTFNIVFSISIRKFLNYIANFFYASNFFSQNNVNIVMEKPIYDQVHINLFQFRSWTDYYLKGKFQILSNIGYFGFYFWFFLIILINRFKEIIKNVFGKVIIYFMGLYFIVVIDPLSLNRNDYSIVLWGSQKYSMLLLLLGLIVLSIYAKTIIQLFQNYVERKMTPIIIGALIFVSLFFKVDIVNFGFSLLSKLVQFYKDDVFYMSIVNHAYWFGIIVLIITMAILSANIFLKDKRISYYLTLCFFVVCFVFFPFFLTNPGKVPLDKTFSYFGTSKETILKNSIYEGDIFKVYFYARSILPKGSILATDFVEVYPHDNYFSLIENSRSQKNSYTITGSCNTENIIFKSGSVSLCSL